MSEALRTDLTELRGDIVEKIKREEIRHE